MSTTPPTRRPIGTFPSVRPLVSCPGHSQPSPLERRRGRRGLRRRSSGPVRVGTLYHPTVDASSEWTVTFSGRMTRSLVMKDAGGCWSSVGPDLSGSTGSFREVAPEVNTCPTSSTTTGASSCVCACSGSGPGPRSRGPSSGGPRCGPGASRRPLLLPTQNRISSRGRVLPGGWSPVYPTDLTFLCPSSVSLVPSVKGDVFT